MAALRRCPRCGNTLPPDVGQGLCPACLLGAGLEPASEEPPGEELTFGFEPIHPGHVLESLARSIGSIPRVLLPDTANDDAGVAVIKPSSDEMPAPAEGGSRYQLFGEIARGGMGAVLRGAIPTWAATWRSRSCSRATRTSPSWCAGSWRKHKSAASSSTPASCRSTSWAPSPTAGPTSR